MRNVLSLCLVVLLAAIGASSSSSEEDVNDIARVMATLQQPRRVVTNNRERQMMELQQYLTLLDAIAQQRNQEAQSDEIGPNFNQAQFMRMLKRDGQAAFQRKCKKITGDDNGYAKMMETQEQVKVCVGNWIESEKIMESYSRAQTTRDYKPLLKNVCMKRSGVFACIDNYSEAFYSCFYPSEKEIARKMDRIFKSMLDLICSNDENDFALFGADGDGQKCVVLNRVEMKTCANKAVYSVTKRIVEKWIENEHFKFEMEPEDCKVFDEVKSCFVSSVENCTNPKVKNFFSSVFQIVRDETQCAAASADLETNTLN